MPGIGVIFNPRSGRNLRDPKAAGRLAKTLGDHGVIREAASIDELYRVAEDFRKLDIDVLGISGGDGTNGTTITGFIDVYQGNALPQIAFLRGGTMNTVANSVGVRRDRPEGLLNQLCQAYRARAATPLLDVERHVMRIRGENEEPMRSSPSLNAEGDDDDGESAPASVRPSKRTELTTKYGFNFGTGVVRGFLSEYYAYGQPPNPIVAAKTLLRAVGSAAVGGDMIKRMAEPFRGSVEIVHAESGLENTVWPERDYLAVAGGTVDQIGLNFRPFYRYAERPNTFHILGIHTSPMGFVRQLPRVWRARSMQPGHTYEAVTDHAIIRSPKSPLRYMVDGDLYECVGPLHISIGPRVRIVVGT